MVCRGNGGEPVSPLVFAQGGITTQNPNNGPYYLGLGAVSWPWPTTVDFGLELLILYGRVNVDFEELDIPGVWDFDQTITLPSDDEDRLFYSRILYRETLDMDTPISIEVSQSFYSSNMWSGTPQYIHAARVFVGRSVSTIFGSDYWENEWITGIGAINIESAIVATGETATFDNFPDGCEGYSFLSVYDSDLGGSWGYSVEGSAYFANSYPEYPDQFDLRTPITRAGPSVSGASLLIVGVMVGVTGEPLPAFSYPDYVPFPSVFTISTAPGETCGVTDKVTVGMRGYWRAIEGIPLWDLDYTPCAYLPYAVGGMGYQPVFVVYAQNFTNQPDWTPVEPGLYEYPEPFIIFNYVGDASQPVGISDGQWQFQFSAGEWIDTGTGFSWQMQGYIKLTVKFGYVPPAFVQEMSLGAAQGFVGGPVIVVPEDPYGNYTFPQGTKIALTGPNKTVKLYKNQALDCFFEDVFTTPFVPLRKLQHPYLAGRRVVAAKDKRLRKVNIPP